MDILKKITDSAKEKFAALPFPHRKDEYWRFADLKAWNADGVFDFFCSSKPRKGESSLDDSVCRGAQLCVADGQLLDVPQISGLKILTMREASEKYPEKIEKFFASASGKFDVLQAARADYGVFVEVADGAEVSLEMSVVNKLNVSAFGAFFALGSGASLALKKTTLTFGGSLSTARFGFDLSDGARLVYAQTKNSEACARMFEREDFSVASDCEVIDAMAQTGLSHSRSERNFEILGERSDIDSRVFLKTRSDITADLRTRQIHHSESSKSNLQVKAALYDDSAIAFTGLIDVCTAAQKTEAYQSCRSLLLSDRAKSQASPILEISANDVMCSHGCTVAEPDKEELFYMFQRGLDEKRALDMVVESFAGTTFEKIPAHAFAADDTDSADAQNA